MRAVAQMMLCGMLSACGESSQEHVRFPLFVAGSDHEAFDAVGDVSVNIEQADLAFGPLYFCAGAQAGELCDTARLEWLESVVVRATDAEPRWAGEITGVTGPVRSWMYDLGFVSLLTQKQPLVLPAAHELGGVSLRITGQSERPLAPLRGGHRAPARPGGRGGGAGRAHQREPAI
jgi:hypothetical protein